MTQKAKAVICCRTQPGQKAQVVKAVMLHEKKVCCAIGDGANDVAMLQVNIAYSQIKKKYLRFFLIRNSAGGTCRNRTLW